ncbi:alpha/beta hydrolase family protein [Pseudonocardia sp.]|uniref:alpha/beta hydrolase family protein n=1 Tax=Pseudonocardia sp. TaxID=60912 RepID=UPI003D13C7EF
MTDVPMRCEDGVTLNATLRPGERGAVVIGSALGVPRRFYGRFADALAARGYGSVTFDYRGVDGSGPEVAPGEIALEHWGSRDLDAALRLARSELGGPVFLVGHSLGGQLPGLAPTSDELAGIVLVGSCAPHPSRYPWRNRVRIELMWRVLVPLFARGPTFPTSRLGLGSSDLPTTVIRTWRDWGLSRDYLFDPRHGVDTTGFAKLVVPMLSWSFADDSFTSREAVDALHSHYPGVTLTHRHVTPPPGAAMGHFGYFRARGAPFWAETVEWLDAAS